MFEGDLVYNCFVGNLNFDGYLFAPRTISFYLAL